LKESVVHQSTTREAFENVACEVRTHGGQRALVLDASGPLTIRTIGPLEQPLRQKVRDLARQEHVELAHIDLSHVSAFDTAGAWLVNRVTGDLKGAGITVHHDGVRPEYQGLLDEVVRATFQGKAAPNEGWRLADATAMVSRVMSAIASVVLDIIAYFGLLITAIARLIVAPSRFRLTAFTHHLEHAGLRAAPIIALICFLIGAVIMQQAALQLSYYGAEVYSVSMLAMLALREVGVLLTVVMVAGRSASAFTAEIGSMKMREEIAAMRTIGIDPVETLIVPRILALLVAVPLLTFLGDVMCLVGGAAVAVFYLGQDLPSYLARLEESVELRHFMAGMIKAPFAAILIGIIGCSEGMKVSGSAESLGQHVTSAVVKAIFIVIIFGAAISMFLASIGS